MAGQGTTQGFPFAQLARIIELVEDKERVGVALAACHTPAAGYEAMMADLEETVGFDSVRRWHLNLHLSQQPIAKSKTDRSAQPPAKKSRHASAVLRDPSRNFADQMVLSIPKSKRETSLSDLQSFRPS